MGKKKKPDTYSIIEYWKGELVFSERQVTELHKDDYNNRIEALSGVRVTYNLPDSEMQGIRGVVEFYVDEEYIYTMSHDGTIYVSATIYQLREILEQCGGCRKRKIKIKTKHAFQIEKKLEKETVMATNRFLESISPKV